MISIKRVSLVVFLLAFSVPLVAREEATFDRTLKVSGAIDLDVQTGSGSISVRNGAGDTVTVHGTIRASNDWFGSRSATDKIKYLQANPPIEQTGNFIRIGRISDEELRRNISISYEITVPQETKLRSRTGSGSQTVGGIRGPVDINAGSGSLRVSDVAAEVRADTGSGNIELNTLGASVRAHAGSGSINASHLGKPLAPGSARPTSFVEGSSSALEFETGSGHIRADDVRGSLRAHTGSGSIEVDGQPAGDWSFRSGSGGVRVRVPSSAAFDLYAHTGSGGITVDHPLTMQGSVGRHEVRGSVRGGGFHLDIQTGSGSVRVE